MRFSLAVPALLLVVLPALAHAGDLTVTLTGIEHAEGTVHVGLWNDPETFRDDDHMAAQTRVPAVPGGLSVTFPDLAPGTYAMMAYHDEDGDGEMDRFMGMIPTEGYALSNDPEVTGPPAFEDSAFTVGEGASAVTARMAY